MSINFFKKDRAFSYARLFFLIAIVLGFTAAGFSTYVAIRLQTVQQNQQASQDFFQNHKTDILQYNNQRKQYVETYGKPTTSTMNAERKMLVDTYLSADGTKGITIHYKVENDVRDDAVLVGYLITGESNIQDTDQIAFLKTAKDQTLIDIQKRCGVAKALSENEDETLTAIYATNNEIIVVKVDKKTDVVIDVKIQNNKK